MPIVPGDHLLMPSSVSGDRGSYVNIKSYSEPLGEEVRPNQSGGVGVRPGRPALWPPRCPPGPENAGPTSRGPGAPADTVQPPLPTAGTASRALLR